MTVLHTAIFAYLMGFLPKVSRQFLLSLAKIDAIHGEPSGK